VTSTAADAALAVAGPDHLSNGAFTLAQPLQITGAPRSWAGPVARDTFTLGFTQPIGATDPLRTGTYATTLTFTLSTTTP
jgi:X-Pro dipeptidyl-peptidase